MALESSFECWYGNGFGAAQWRADKDGFVRGCELRLTEERLYLINGKLSVSCPWAGVNVQSGASDQGNAVLTAELGGEKGGTSKVVLPAYGPNAFWAEFWRVVPSMRPRLGAARPEMLPVTGSAEALLDYLGGYSLDAKKSFGGVWVRLHQFGVTIEGGTFKRHRRTMIAWKDVTQLAVEGMMDPQRQRSLARTVEFGALGGLAGKKFQSAYLIVTTRNGVAVFHTEKATAPEIQGQLGSVLGPGQSMIASRSIAPAAPAAVSVADELVKLAALKSDGILTEEEFAAQKARLLEGS
jgi:hypothetical protein